MADKDLENINSVLDFWFGDNFEHQFPPKEKMSLWFENKDLADKQIKAKFSGLINDALDGKLSHWLDKPKGRLALIILLDQFTRNKFRNTQKAFAGDKIARALCLDGIAEKDHKDLIACELIFFYMPLEHSEDLKDQEMHMKWSNDYLKKCDKRVAKQFEQFHHWVVLHYNIIKEFGRFPWRNNILGRKSNGKEVDYLKTSEDFGQK